MPKSDRLRTFGVGASCFAIGALLLACSELKGEADGTQLPIPDFSSADFPWINTSGEYLPPPAGFGPITYDRANPQMTHALDNRGVLVEEVLPLANLNDPNLKPWVVDSLRYANAEVLAGEMRFGARASCRPAGVPQFLVFGAGFQPIYFIQSPNQVVIVNQADMQVRHIYLNVPHSAHPLPSWYGESIGHYEDDELVVDTTGFNARTFLDDTYNVPHTTQLHVVERFKLIEEGKTLQVSFTVDDPGAFNAPWAGLVHYQRAASVRRLTEQICAENNVEHLGKFYDTPTATKSNF